MERSTDHDFYQHVTRPLVAMAKSYLSGYPGYRHSHPARAAALWVIGHDESYDASRVVPCHRAVGFPLSYFHQTAALGPLGMRTLYIRPDACPKRAAKKPCVISVSPLLREFGAARHGDAGRGASSTVACSV
jgi:hypothetical protein